MRLRTWAALSLVLTLPACKTTSVHPVTHKTEEKAKPVSRTDDVRVAVGARSQVGSPYLLVTGFPHVRVTNPGDLNANVVVLAGVKPDTEIIPIR